MKDMRNKQIYEEPELEVIRMTERDVITTSGELWLEYEGEIIKMKQ